MAVSYKVYAPPLSRSITVVQADVRSLVKVDGSLVFGHVLLGRFYPVLLYQIGTYETRALIDVDVPEGHPGAAGGVMQVYPTYCPTSPLPSGLPFQEVSKTVTSGACRILTSGSREPLVLLLLATR